MNTLVKPLVSVIVPVYNVEKYLDDCLNSIKQQTYSNLEIIVVEDCSTDNSLNELQLHLNDERIKFIQHAENSGLSAARNTGIEAASGEFTMFVDSDDIIDLNFVQACLRAAQEANADVVLSTAMPFQDGESVQVTPELSSRVNRYHIISEGDYFTYPHYAWLKFMRTDLIREKQLLFLVDQYYEDWPFHWETGFVASKIVAVSDGYYHYRQRGDSITGAGDLKLLHQFSSQRVIVEIIEKFSAPTSIKKILADRIYNGLWFVLTSIENRSLRVAIPQIKKELYLTEKYRSYSSPNIKSKVLIYCLKTPDFVSFLLLVGLRKVLKVLSPARRKL